MNQSDTLGQAVAVGFESPLEVVQGRQYRAAHLRLATQQRVLSLAGRSLAVVLEVGPRPLRELEVLVALALQVLDERVEVLLDRLLLRGDRLRRSLSSAGRVLRARLLHYDRSSSTTSASTTSSSAAAPFAPAPSPAAACCSDADW